MSRQQMKRFAAVVVLAIVPVGGVARAQQRDLLAPAPKLDPAERQTIGGAYQRARRAVGDWPYRELDLERPNSGLRGRVNSTRDAAEQAEFPSLPEPPPMPNY